MITKKSLKSLKILNKLDRVKDLEKIKNKFYVFDCETWDKNARPENFAFCCMTGHNYRKVFHTIEDFQNELFSGQFKNKYIFCHWAEFDLNVIFSNIKKCLDKEAVFNGTAFIMAQKEKVIFCDSLNIYKTGVKEIGKMMGFEKLERPEKFGQGVKFDITNEDIEYCYRDCEVVWQALEKIFLEVESVRPTLASLSLIYFRRFYQKFHIAYNELSNNFFDSYYGGRVEAFKLGETNSGKYDINSMYPYVMSMAVFPNPKFLKISDTKDIKGLKHDMNYYEGHATLTVFHKKNNFGFLPVKHDGKLVFPNGKFKGTWCFPEIRFALEQNIIEIIEVHEVITSFKMESPFKTFSTELYQKRLDSIGIMKTVLKLLLNSLYGKFAQREKFKEIYCEKIPFELVEMLQKEKIGFEIKTFNKDREDCYLHIFEPVTIKGNEVKRNNSKFGAKIHTIPCFSAYITSIARVYLLQQMLKYNKYIVTYVDTDCICLEKPVKIVDSNLLGEFKQETEIITNIFGNKNYIELKDGKNNRKIKGVSKKAIQLDSVDGKEVFEYDQMTKTKTAIRQNKDAGVWKKVTKNISNEYTKRQKNKKGKTRPLYFK